MGKKPLIVKCLAVGIILLFIGTTLNASTGQITTIQSSPIPRGNTLYVGGNGPNNYSKIQSAINNASDGDVIFIYNGVYYEHILVNKSISLIGENTYSTIINGGQKSQISVVKIITSPFHIWNLTIQNNDWHGIEAGFLGMQNTMNNSTIYNCRVLKTHSGVLFWNSSTMLVSNCTIFDNLEGVVLVESKYCRIEHCVLSNRQRCVSLNTGAQSNTVVDCLMSGNASEEYGYGIDSFGDYNIISHCIISNEGDGIFISTSNHSRIDNCSIYNNSGRGICISKGNYNVIENCTIRFNGNETFAICYGIHVFEGTNNLVTWCNISDNSQGGVKFMWLCNQNTVTKSTIKHNGHITNGEGIRCDSPNNIYLNNFIDNYIQAYDRDSNSKWDDEKLGNYWNDYSGKDLNNDAIGDKPYSLHEKSNNDTHPLICPYNPAGPSILIMHPIHAEHTYIYLFGFRIIRFPETILLGPTLIRAIAVDYTHTTHISKVVFSIDGFQHHTDRLRPYTWLWCLSSKLHHTHTLTATAYDNLGRTGSDTLLVKKFF